MAEEEIRILHLEDNPDDVRMLSALLESGGLRPLMAAADDRESFLRLLEEFRPDLVISDFTLPSFDGLSALNLARQRAPHIPFLFVSGSIGEDRAVECLKQGAQDYLLKDKLARLPAAVTRALEEARIRRERQSAEEHVLRQAFYDGLTGLGNRAFFLRRLQQSLERGAPEPLAVAVIGIDDFKPLCDGLGWEAGDALLQATGNRLLEAAASGADCVCRVGGDEFALLFEGAGRVESLDAAVEKALQCFQKPLPWNGQEIFLTAGLGIAHRLPEHATPDELLRDCENALHRAKAFGKSGRTVFDPAMRRQAVDFMETVNDLRQAMKRRELFLHYQPIVDLRAGRTAGFEALVRWNHPRRGQVPPLEFLPVAERMHLMAAIGDFVLREACRAAASMRASGYAGLTVSVNVSAQEIELPGLCERVEAALRESGLAPDGLKLEITESGFLRAPEAAILLLRRLRDLGVALQIDDFGTGYSSLSYLHRLPVQALKIDRSFVAPIDGDGDGAIAAAIIDLARNLGMEVVAEGVETRAQLDFLAKKDCEFAQGFLFARPMPEAEALAFAPRPLVA